MTLWPCNYSPYFSGRNKKHSFYWYFASNNQKCGLYPHGCDDKFAAWSHPSLLASGWDRIWKKSSEIMHLESENARQNEERQQNEADVPHFRTLMILPSIHPSPILSQRRSASNATRMHILKRRKCIQSSKTAIERWKQREKGFTHPESRSGGAPMSAAMNDPRSQTESVARKVEDSGIALRCVLKVKNVRVKKTWIGFQNSKLSL